MTPEETKERIQSRLRELGWTAHIGDAGYQRISRYTDGADDAAERLCRKLASLGALHSGGEIDDDLVDMAVTDLVRGKEEAPPKPSPAREAQPLEEQVTIEQLAAALEAKVAACAGHAEPRSYEQVAAAHARAKPAVLPKLLLADASPERRERIVEALQKDFRVVTAADGEQAWRILCDD